jgi:hypothetical protein
MVDLQGKEEHMNYAGDGLAMNKIFRFHNEAVNLARTYERTRQKESAGDT